MLYFYEKGVDPKMFKNNTINKWKLTHIKVIDTLIFSCVYSLNIEVQNPRRGRVKVNVVDIINGF